jgi:predicted nucleic acid-binding protein
MRTVTEEFEPNRRVKNDQSLSHKLAMADSIILASARAYDADLLTLDSDFAGIASVTVFSKKQ